MSIAAQKTPKEDANYLINRLISDLIGTFDTCAASATDLAVDATYDCLGSVYPLIGLKGASKELIGTTVSIGGGYLLATNHSLNGYRSPYTSYGAKTSPGLAVVTEVKDTLHLSEILELQVVTTDIPNSVDLVLLRVTCIDDCHKLKSARLPAFEPTNVSSELLPLINNFGVGALFIGFGAMSESGISQELHKNDITTFICNQELAKQTISQLHTAPCEGFGIEKAKKKDVEKYEHIFLSMGSPQRHPHWNDSGGGLFVFFKGRAYLVGIHFKAIKYGMRRPLTYPLFVNLLSAGPSIYDVIQNDRSDFLNGTMKGDKK